MQSCGVEFDQRVRDTVLANELRRLINNILYSSNSPEDCASTTKRNLFREFNIHSETNEFWTIVYFTEGLGELRGQTWQKFYSRNRRVIDKECL